jgi:ABC-type antimicrobial peptide transport system permease subunit
MLFGMASGSGWAIASAAAVLAFTAMASAALPAFRAVRVDPLSALRKD